MGCFVEIQQYLELYLLLRIIIGTTGILYVFSSSSFRTPVQCNSTKKNRTV